MRIAGINSQPRNPSSGHVFEGNVEADARGALPGAPVPATANNRTPESLEIITVQNGGLGQPEAKNLIPNGGGVSDGRIRFYVTKEIPLSGVWKAYRSSDRAASVIPDDTTRHARLAICEYLQTHYLEERFRFEQTLGIDEFA